ncbi:hypothetical protein RQP46_007354 [Phenoliferia psychrophenolica]
MSPSVDDKAPTAACESARPLAKAADLTSLRLCHRVILLTGCFPTINVARFAMAAAAQPLFARGSDRFGRLELCVASLVLYVVGSVIQACALNVGTFAAGAVIYQLGYTGLQLMVEVLVADTTSLKSRLFFTFIPVSPFLINTWVSGTIAQSVLDHAGWKWGFGIGAIVMPAASNTVCYVSFGQSIATSTRISNLYSFVACISGIGAGILVRKIRRMRHMMFFGVAVFAVGFGLVVRYRGGPTQFAGMVGGQVVLGIAGGFFTYPGQVAIQAAVEHRYLAVATSLYLASYYVGSAVFEVSRSH